MQYSLLHDRFQELFEESICVVCDFNFKLIQDTQVINIFFLIDTYTVIIKLKFLMQMNLNFHYDIIKIAVVTYNVEQNSFAFFMI